MQYVSVVLAKRVATSFSKNFIYIYEYIFMRNLSAIMILVIFGDVTLASLN